MIEKHWPNVGEWTKEKHKRLEYYVGICSGVRKKFLEKSSKTATYIDLFCGSPQVQIKNTDKKIDSGAITAWKTSKEKGTPFSEIFIADKKAEYKKDTAKKLTELGAKVTELEGCAVDAAQEFSKIHDERLPCFQRGLHFAFLDPFGLIGLDFEIIKILSQCKRMDILIHISSMGLRRNLDKFMKPDNQRLNTFAPGLKENLNLSGNNNKKDRADILNYWKKKTVELGFNNNEVRTTEVRGNNNQLLYWLALIAKHKLADKFWGEVLERTALQKTLL